MIFIDGDFATGMGNCPYHCSPTCHPGQVDPNKWHYGCTHKAWWANKYDDFVPFVECEGDKNKCDLKSYKQLHFYIKGLKARLKNAENKVFRLQKEIAEINELTKEKERRVTVWNKEEQP